MTNAEWEAFAEESRRTDAKLQQKLVELQLERQALWQALVEVRDELQRLFAKLEETDRGRDWS